MSKKKKTKRSQIKHPSLEKHYNSRVRQEYIDADYLDQLSPEELDWYARFMEEHNNANFRHKGDTLIDDPEKRKQIYNENNARNRCLYGRSKAHGNMSKFDIKQIQDFIEEKRMPSKNDTEDALIDILDNSENLSNSTNNSNE